MGRGGGSTRQHGHVFVYEAASPVTCPPAMPCYLLERILKWVSAVTSYAMNTTGSCKEGHQQQEVPKETHTYANNHTDVLGIPYFTEGFLPL